MTVTSSTLIQESYIERDLNNALLIANKHVKKIDGYVTNVEDRKLEANQPILLVLNQKGKQIPIGITHFAHLRENFDKVPFSENARTIDELAQSILKAVEIHEKAEKDSNVLITAAGVPFYSSKDVPIAIDHQGILQIDGKPVLYNGKPLPAAMLKGEEGITFAKMKNGDYETQNPIDQRKGCGIFFKKKTMEVYRG